VELSWFENVPRSLKFYLFSYFRDGILEKFSTRNGDSNKPWLLNGSSGSSFRETLFSGYCVPAEDMKSRESID